MRKHVFNKCFVSISACVHMVLGEEYKSKEQLFRHENIFVFTDPSIKVYGTEKHLAQLQHVPL